MVYKPIRVKLTLLFFILPVSMLRWAAGPSAGSFSDAILVVCALAAVFLTVRIAALRLEITDEEIRVRNILRAHKVRWDELKEIRVRRPLKVFDERILELVPKTGPPIPVTISIWPGNLGPQLHQVLEAKSKHFRVRVLFRIPDPDARRWTREASNWRDPLKGRM